MTEAPRTAETVVIELVRRRPKLAEVLAAVDELIAHKRNCRLLVEVVDGVVRVHNVHPARTVRLE